MGLRLESDRECNVNQRHFSVDQIVLRDLNATVKQIVMRALSGGGPEAGREVHASQARRRGHLSK